MNKTIHIILTIALALTATALQAQSIGDFRTKASGLWSDVSIWQTWDGTTWTDASTLPDVPQDRARVSTGDSIVVQEAMVLNNITIELGGILTLSHPLTSFTDTLFNYDPSLILYGQLYIAENASLKGNGNLVNNWGGEISVINDATMEVTVTNNGTIYLNAFLTVLNSTFTNNNTLVLGSSSTLSLTNSTLINKDSISIPGNAYITSANAGLVMNSSTGVLYKSEATATLRLDPAITFSNAGVIKGVGSYDLPSAVLNTGTISPGNNSAGSLSITPYAVSGRSPLFEMEIDGTGAIAGSTYDQVTFNTIAPMITDLSGSSLVCTDNGNTDPIGTIYTIMTSASFITGNFTSISIPPGYGIHYNLYTVTLEKQIALEVTWGAFTAKNIGNKSELQWSILKETSAAYFTIEYSTDGFQYTTLDTIMGKGTGTVAFYEYLHTHPSSGTNYYHIKVTEENGTENYSPTAALVIGGTVVETSPNPVTDRMHLTLSADKANMKIMNSQGQEVKQQEVFQGLNTLFFGDLAPGVYQLFIQQDNQDPEKTVIVKL